MNDYTNTIELEFAYPTSTDAVKNGFSRFGCWIVYLGYEQLKAFNTMQSAIEYGNKLKYKWSDLTMKYRSVSNE